MLEVRHVESPRTVGAGLFAFALFSLGCGSSPDPNQLLDGRLPTSIPGPGVDEAAVLASINFQNYQTNPEFQRVSVIYASSKDPVNVAIWISAAAAEDYLKINPNASKGPGVFLPAGTTVVRAVFDPSNFTDLTAVQALTILTKGSPGYDLSFGDWAFAVTDANGAVLPTSAIFPPPDGGQPDSTPLFGEIPGCHMGCHEDERGPTNDYLFGVDPNNQLSL